jgi:23S rRNA pseudouridine1911/1915/1917 synthase
VAVSHPSIEILYEDNHVLGIFKPAGLLTQGDRTGDPTALELAKRYLKERYAKPGAVFLGAVHRLDRPVSGVMVFARTSKAASRLSRSFHDRDVEKVYLAVVWGEMGEETGELRGHLERAHMRARLVAAATTRSKAATLAFRVLARGGGISVLEVTPRTGRHHQIRLQLSAAGHPIVGDMKYKAPEPLADRSIALHAARLRFPHPVREEIVTLTAPPPPAAPWIRFESALADYFA